jgi:hypothetical protein
MKTAAKKKLRNLNKTSASTARAMSIKTEVQLSENNMMHFLFNLLIIKGLYMFRALFADPQEALNKGHLVHCVHVMSVGCTKTEV